MRIALLGQAAFGADVFKALHPRYDIVGVFCPPDSPKGKVDPLKEAAQEVGKPVFQPKRMKDPEAYEQMKKLAPDLAILAFVTDIVPGRVLALPRLGSICYHPSILPRHRGASAINWAVIEGDTRTGLTIFWVDEGIDTGDILVQKEVDIGPDETTGAVYFNKLYPLGVEALVEAVDLVAAGKAPRIPQDHARATYEPPCDEKVAGINWEQPGRVVYNFQSRPNTALRFRSPLEGVTHWHDLTKAPSPLTILNWTTWLSCGLTAYPRITLRWLWMTSPW